MHKALRNIDTKQLTKFNQLVLLDYNGFIVHSCDTIFSTNTLKDSIVFQYIPFVESIFQELIKLKPTDPEIQFSRVEVPANFLPGYYDFTFSSIELENQQYILWSIYDFTGIYLDLMKYQQYKNELEIYRQSLELQSKKIQKISDIQYNKFLFNHTPGSSNKTYFLSKLQELLLSKTNILGNYFLPDITNNSSKVFDTIQFVLEEFDPIRNELNNILNEENHFLDEIAFSSITELFHNAIEEVSKALKSDINITLKTEQDLPHQVIVKADIVQQILSSLLMTFYEQDRYTHIEAFLSVSGKETAEPTINFLIIDKNVDNLHIINPEGLPLRISLIKKLVEICRGKIVPIYNPSNPQMRISIQIPCKLG